MNRVLWIVKYRPTSLEFSAKYSAEELSAMQCSDSDVGSIVELLLKQKETPKPEELSGESENTKFYAAMWFAWRIKDNVVYRDKNPDVTDSSKWQLLVPVCLREEVMRCAHSGITGGHMGVRKTTLQLLRRCYWKGCRRDIERYRRQCEQCAKYWRGKLPKTGLLQPTVVVAPHERWSIDLTGPHPRSKKGNVYILTCIDRCIFKVGRSVPDSKQGSSDGR